MKKVFILFAMLGLTVASCQKNSESLELSKAELTFTAAGGSETVDATASGAVTAESSAADWCTVTVNATKVIVEVAANPDAAERTAVVTVSCKSAKKTINVKQSGLEANLDGINSEVEIPAEGGKVSLGTYTSNVKATAESNVEWATTEVTDTEIFVNAQANDGEDRSGVITVKVGGLEKEVSISQAQNATVKITVEKGATSGGMQDVTFSYELPASLDDFAFSVFTSAANTASDEELIAALQSDAFHKSDFDQNGGAITLSLKMESNFVAVAAGISKGNYGAVTKVVVSTDPGTPSAQYDKWLGKYELSYHTFEGEKQTTELIVEKDVSGETFKTRGWNDCQITGEDGQPFMPDVPALFDAESNSIVFTSAYIMNVSANGQPGEMFMIGVAEINQQEQTFSYFQTDRNNPYGIALAEYKDGEEMLLTPFTLQTGEGDVTLVGEAIMANVGGQWMLAADIWAFPMTIKRTGDLDKSRAYVATEETELKSVVSAKATCKFTPNFYYKGNALSLR